jgi:hypothetical protein
VLSFEAVTALRARGFNIRRLEDGLPEWRAAGLPVRYPHPDSGRFRSCSCQHLGIDRNPMHWENVAQ